MSDSLTDIAIVGMAGRFPGARGVGELWGNLCAGVESIRQLRPDELEVPYAAVLARLSNYVRARAIMDDADKFDASFFGIFPKEAELIDPQQRVFLECCWHAFEDGGYDPLAYAGVASVYAGCSFNSYFAQRGLAQPGFVADYIAGYQVSNFTSTLASNFEFLPTRVAYKLNLRGSAFSLNCGCSTSLVAICQACLGLQNYQCDLALAGGVSITFPQKRGYFYDQGGMVSPDGHCRTFDEAAQGTVFGDGCAVVLLKRLVDAVADGDHIYAVIKGFGVSNDGAAKVGFTAPGVDGQASAIAMAHTAAGIDPASITYVEAHGTATPLGDPIEIAALTQAFRRATNARQFCAIGTAKTNVGHLDVAAGATGLIKAALSLHHQMLPPMLHFQRPNPKLNLEESPFYVNTKLTSWQRDGTPLRAGVSAFGIGGTNAHVVLEEAPESTRVPSKHSSHLLVLSAKTPTALESAASNLARYLAGNQNPAAELADVAHTLMLGRHPFASRTMVVARDSTEAIARLTDPARRVVNSGSRPNPLAIAFMFSGQGSQYFGMGRQLYSVEPLFKEPVDVCLDSLKATAGLDLGPLFHADDPACELIGNRINDTAYAQPALFIVEYALAQMWMRLGIRPAVMIGHSVGEFAAACVAGVFTVADALRLVAARGRLMQDLPRGAMLSVRLSEEKVAGYLGADLNLAGVNGPSLTVVAGPLDAVAELEAQFKKDGVMCRRLRTSHAFHSRMMAPVREPFAELVKATRLNHPDQDFISSVTGALITDSEATDPNYWADQILMPVRFADGARRLREQGITMLETGPGNTLSMLARQHPARDRDQIVVSSLPDSSGSPTDEETMLTALGQLWMLGAEIDWTQMYVDEKRLRVALPAYPFERKRFWFETPETAANGVPSRNSAASLETAGTLYATIQIDAAPRSESDANDPPAFNSARPADQSTGTQAMQSSISDSKEQKVRSILEGIFEDLSGSDVAAAGGSATFLEMGFDSLFLTQVSQALQKRFQIKITFRQLMDQVASLDALTSYIVGILAPDALPATVQDSPAPTIATEPRLAEVPASAAAVVHTPSAPEISDTLSASSGAYREAGIEALLRSQLQTMSELMSKQLEILKGAIPNGHVSFAVPSAAVERAQTINPPAVAVASPTSHAPTPRKFLPFRPVEAGSGSGLSASQEQNLRDLIERYTRKTAGSKRLTQIHRSHLADPRVAAGFRVQWKELVYPLVTERSRGSKIWDVDGNEYIDVVNGYGPVMFGHAPDFVTKAIEEQLKLGYETGPQSPLAGKVAQMICEMTGMDRVTFCNTGSEAVVAALRVARTITARDQVVIFTGAYHGMFDEVVVKSVKTANGLRSLPVAPGIPREMVENIVVLDYGSDEALHYIAAHAKELAAVMVEPVQSRHPAVQPVEFLKQVRRITTESNTALIFDEVVTGFRVHQGGCQALFGIKADLATYGKVLGGGLPIGILAGSSAFMDALDGGMWRYGDESYPETGVTFFAGTFVRHPLALAAAAAVLKHLKEQGPALQAQVSDLTGRMADEMNAFLAQRQLPVEVSAFGSIAHFIFPPELPHASLFYYYMRERGVHIQEGFPMFLTTAHSAEDIAQVVSAFKSSVIEMQTAGFLPGAESASQENLASHAPAKLHANGVDRAALGNANSAVAQSAMNETGKHENAVRRAALTESQLEIFLSAKLSDAASCCYNESFTLKLEGELNSSVLFKAINTVIARHEALRATFGSEGDYQEFAPELKLEIASEDLSALDSESRAAGLDLIITADAKLPFDLSHGPMVRARLVKLGPDEHDLIFTSHHIVCDGWSTNVVLDELSQLYSAMSMDDRCALPPALKFSSYSRLQAEHFASAEGAATEKYWVELFKQPPAALDLPLDRSRPPVRSYGGATRRRRVPVESYRNLKKAAAQQKCTLFVTLLAGFQILLSRLSGQDDIVVGIPAAGQSALDDQILVGHCVNFLPLRGRLNDDSTVAEYLAAVKQILLGAYDHQNYTYGRLIRKLALKRDPSRLPLTEIQFNLERVGTGIAFAGLKAEVDPNPKSFVNQDIFLNIIETSDGLILDCDYNVGLFDGETIDRWLGHYMTILEGIANEINQRISTLPILSAAERHQLVTEWNATESAFPADRCVHQLFEEQVARTPDAVAVSFENQRLTYRELNDRADRLADYLRKLGVGPGVLVGVFVERSLEMIVGLLGVLKAGGAYLPMDPTYPAARIAFVLDDTQAPILLTQENLANNLAHCATRLLCLDADWDTIAAEGVSDSSPRKVNSSDLAYVIYTSGSTGQPKGVEVPHRAVVNLLCSMGKEPGLSSSDTLLAITTLSFDIAALELFLPLCVGAKLIIASRATAADGTELLKLAADSHATVIQATPITFRMLIEAGWNGSPRLKVLCGGEALGRELANQLVERADSVWNMYGPTETTIWSATAQVQRADGPVPIGPPIDNTRFYVLDRGGQLAPIGAPGELHIGGDGVACGYFRRPDLTAERFISDGFQSDSKARMYKTGDLVRRLSDSSFEFLGRLDQQVKLRGYRIELGEIETALARHPGVREAVVALHEDVPGDKRLVAYLVTDQQALTVTAVREFLSGKLPNYMLPSAVVRVDSMPLTPNGKVDRRALPAPDTASKGRVRELVSPRTPQEKTLAAIWSEVLRVEKVGIHDDLFELGADSLHIFQIAARANKAGIRIEPAKFLKYRNIVALLAQFESEPKEEARAMPIIVPVSRDKYRLKRTVAPQ